jgi:hypothetical protein
MSTTGAARMAAEGEDHVEQRVTPLELFLRDFENAAAQENFVTTLIRSHRFRRSA